MNTIANQKRLIPMAAALLLTVGLGGCADEGGLGGTTTGGTTTGGLTTGGTGGGNTTGGTTTGGPGGGGDTTGGTTTGGNTTGGTGGGDTTGGTTTGGPGGGGDTTGGTTTGGDTTGGTGGGDTTGGTGGGDTTGGTTGGEVGGIICNPLSDTFRPIQVPNASASGSTAGLCIGCSVTSPDNAIDADITTVSALNTPVGLLGASSQLSVVDTATLYPAGRRAGFVVFDPAGALLTLTLLQTVTVSAVNNGVVQDSANFSTLTLDLLGSPIIGTTDPQFLSFVPTQPFNELRIEFGSTVNALAQLGIVQACVSVNPAVLP